MATYYAFLDSDDICTMIADPTYEASDGYFPYQYLDYSTENQSCILLPDSILSFDDAYNFCYQKKYDRDTKTWSEVSPKSNQNDVIEYDSFTDFPSPGTTLEEDPEYDCIYIARDTNKTYRWDTEKRAYAEINAGITVLNTLTSSSTTSALSAAQGKVLNDSKVDKVSGKGLSTNDYTTAEKTKLAGIATGANNTTVENSLTSTSTTNALSAAQGKVLNEKFVVLAPTDSTAIQTINSPVTINGVLRSSYGQIYYATSSDATISTNNLNLTLAAQDTCTINATTTQVYHVVPRGSNAYDLGSSSFRFRYAYLNNSPNVSSDKRLKTDIKDADSEKLIDFIKKINICNFKFKEDLNQTEKIGVIAQQLIEANPNIAEYFVANDDDYLSVRVSDLVFPLISCVQYLLKEVEELKKNTKEGD